MATIDINALIIAVLALDPGTRALIVNVLITFLKEMDLYVTPDIIPIVVILLVALCICDEAFQSQIQSQIPFIAEVLFRLTINYYMYYKTWI